jgi:hypothetical protein
VASANFMRLSLRRGAFAVLCSAAWQEIRVRSGRDDKFVVRAELSRRIVAFKITCHPTGAQRSGGTIWSSVRPSAFAQLPQQLLATAGQHHARRAMRLDLAAIHHNYIRGGLEGLGNIVRDIQRGNVALR